MDRSNRNIGLVMVVEINNVTGKIQEILLQMNPLKGFFDA